MSGKNELAYPGMRGRRVAAILLAATLTSASACDKARWKKSAELVRDTGVIVQLERNPEFAGEHPLQPALDAEVLGEQLCALAYIDRFVVAAERPVESAWPCPRASLVAEGIAAGLSEAGPEERVRFWVRWDERDPSLPMYIPTQRHTRGVAFWRAGGLELVFDRVGELEGETPRANADPTERRTRRVRLVPPEGAELIEVEGKRQPMHLRIAAHELGHELGHEAGPEEVGEADPEPALSPATAARLELLDELHRAGEIDDESYARRRAKLLEGAAE